MKKLLKLLTVSTLTLSMLFGIGCNGGGNNENNDGGDSNVDEAYVYSMNRLKNADFSFNFTSGGANSINLVSLTTTSGSNDDSIITGTPNYFVDEGALTYFEGYANIAKETAENAKIQVDELTRFVTVLNKLVVFNGVMARYVGYDEENDVVTAFIGDINDDIKQDAEDGVAGDGSIIGSTGENVNAVLPKGTLTHGTLIKIYDDVDGDEVVEYTTFGYQAKDAMDSTKGSYSCVTIKYVPLKEYFFSHETYETLPGSLDVIEGKGTFTTFKALNVDGKFIGSEIYGQFDNPNYECEVFFEMGDGFYVFDLTRNFGAYTAGYDYIDFSLDLENMYDYQLSLKALGGWNSYYHNVRDLNGDDVINQEDKDLSLQNPIYFGEGDYISLTNGKKLYQNSVWSKETGFVRISWENYTATYEDGREINLTEFFEFAHGVDYGFISIDGIVVQPHYTFEQLYTGQLYGGWIPMQVAQFPALETQDGYIEYQPKENLYNMFKDFLTENNLTLINNNPLDIIDYTVTASYIKDTLVDEELQLLFNRPYSQEGFSSIISDMAALGKSVIEECRYNFNNYERMLRKDMPVITDNYSLISTTTQGKVTVANGKFDFSGVSVTVPKTNFLNKGTSYGVMVYLEGNDSKVLDGAFTPYTYDKKSVTLSGNTAIDIPSVTDGNYKLKLAFGKPTEDGFIRLSNVVELDVNNFTKVETQKTINAKLYNISYETINGKFNMTSVYNDVGAPTIVDKKIIGNAISVDLEEGALIADFIKNILVQDDVDGRIYLNVSNFSLNGNTVKIDDKIDFTKSYRLVVTDSSNNVIDILVNPVLNTKE